MGTAAAVAEGDIQQKQIQFAKGQSGATVSDKVKGSSTVSTSGKPSRFIPGSYAEIVGAKGELGLLFGPSMAVAHVGKGRLVHILKCEPNDGLWCEVEVFNDKSVHGWVKGLNLKAK